MGKVTAGNRLYFYQLLSEKIGVGKQVLIPRVEEVLAAEDIEPADLEFETTADLLAAMPEIVKLTVFKKGRVYATLIANEELDGILERLAAPAPAEKGAKGGAKSWKKKKGPKDPTPAKPRKRVVAAAPEPEPEPEPEPFVEVVSEVPSDVLASEDEAAECPPESSETPVEETPSQEPEPAPEPSEPETPQPEPTISLTITYDPYEGTLNSFDAVVPQPEEEPLPKPEPAAAPEPQPNRGLPESFENDVLIKDALLRVLSLLLPFDANPTAVLDEDWRYACSCGLVSGTRARASFPLRYLHEDGSPVEVTIKHTTKTPGGKSWAVALVDGDDGSGTAHDAAGIEGLPTADEGAWDDLSGSARTDADPVRELAAFAQVGSWDTTLGTLATMAAPERWNYPGEGVGQASRYGILREYLAVTFHRIMAEGKLRTAGDGSLAAFDTGLLTPFSERIYAVLTPLKGAIPWKLGFAVAGSGELGMRLAATFDPLPEPACYLARLEDVVPQQGRLLIIDTASLLSSQLGRFPRSFIVESLDASGQTRGIIERFALDSDDAPLGSGQLVELSRAIKAEPGLYRRMGRSIQDAVELALRRAQASYRIAAPVYDPADDWTKLLVPLCLVDDRRVDCAAVLALMPSGAYQVSAVISLERAYACARVVSAEPPRWLA
ncbi:MAG: DUF3825 domain-containing protein [Coriobacteriaceae bacterium]|nr:DUF3825 domain-containing protein [Coriobacteriaceae bacterium]